MKHTYSVSELPFVAGMVLENSLSKTLLFYGAMGVGKTTLIKELAKKIGVQDNLSSPTFSLVNEYEVDQDKLYHFDFYRIHDEKEAMDIGLEEYLNSGSWNLIEWPEKIVGLLPQENTKIQLTINDNGTRTIHLTNMK
jgi:tRNA threonylcarbamoyladenosine biosynthesis protein TsaE